MSSQDPTPLADRFPSVTFAARPALELFLRARLDAARQAWPGLALGDADFVELLRTRIPADVDPATALAPLCSDDLYLACACARGETAAIAAFQRSYSGELAAAFARLAIGGSDPEDLRQQLLTRLFVAVDERPPRIAEYSGQGSLRAWLKVVALRLRIDLERRKRDRRDNFSDAERLVDVGVGDDPELAHLKQHYRAEFRTAFTAALALLTAEQRALLRLQAVEGLSATDIARIYKVHRATGKRWLADARERLVAETGRLLAEQLGGRGVALASIVRLIRSDLNVSLCRGLGEA